MNNFIKRVLAIFRKISYLYLANTVTSIGGFVVVLLLANSLDQSEYGYYKYVFSITGTLGVLSLTGGFRNTVLQSVAKAADGVVPHLFRRNLPLSLPMLLGGITACIWYVGRGNDILGYGILITTFFTILGNNGVIAYGYLNGRRLYLRLLLLQCIQVCVNVLALFIVLRVTNNVLVIIAVSAATTGIVLTLFYFYVQNLLRNKVTDTLINSFGKHLSIMSMISTVMVNIDSIFIFKMLGAEALALYALATPFVDRLIGFLKATYYYILPTFTAQGPQNAYRSLYKKSIVVTAFSLVIYFLYYAFAPIFFELFFPRYIDSVELTRLFALTIPVIAFGILFDAFLDSLIEARRKYIVKLSVTSIRLVTLILFIPHFGIPGVIWSEIIARFLGTCITIILIEHRMRDTKHSQRG